MDKRRVRNRRNEAVDILDPCRNKRGVNLSFSFCLRENYILFYEKDNVVEVKQETKYNKRL